MGSKWKDAAGQRFSEEWPLLSRNCLISSKCVVFYFRRPSFCGSSVQMPSANECLLWPEGHTAGTPPASPRRRSALVPSDTRPPTHHPHRPRRHKRPRALLAQYVSHPRRAPTRTRILRCSPGRSTGVGGQREQTGSRAVRAGTTGSGQSGRGETRRRD